MYDEAKRFSEACTMAYSRERKVDTRIIRIFNTYGPRMDPYDGRVVISFIRQALRNEPLTVFGDGTQTRSLCYVSDLIRGINLTMESDFCEPINLGNSEEITILQIAQNYSGHDPREHEQDHISSDAAGRSARAMSGYYAGETDFGLVPDGLAQGRPGKDDRVLPRDAVK